MHVENTRSDIGQCQKYSGSKQALIYTEVSIYIYNLEKKFCI